MAQFPERSTRQEDPGIRGKSLPFPRSKAYFAPMDKITAQLKDFLQYVALNFIKDPHLAELRVGHPGEKKVNFRLILSQPDVATLIGRQGFTASTIRSMMKAAAEREGVTMTLRIHSHDEERQYIADMEAKAMEE